MRQPDALKKDEVLVWPPGRGTDVWALFCACITGDLSAVVALLKKDPSLARSHYGYRKPLCFEVRENRVEIVAPPLERDPDPAGLALNDTLLEIARDRGYAEMETLLETKIAGLLRNHGAQ